MDNKKIEILSNMRWIPLRDIEGMYETLINYSRELFGARRIAFYIKDDKWKKEYSYPLEEMLEFELKDDQLEEIYNKFNPYILEPEEAAQIGISLDGTTVFLPLGTKEYPIGLLLLTGIKMSKQELEEEYSVLKIFSRYAEIFIYATKKITERTYEVSPEEDPLVNLKKDIVSMLSRNFRTPLASILAYAETLRNGEGLSEKEKKEFIETIYEESKKLKEELENMMDYLSIFMEE